MHRKNPLPWLLISCGVLIIITASAYNELNQRQLAEATPTPAAASQVQRVTLEEAKKAYDSGAAIFVDVRDSSSFSTAHIPGAMLIPISDLATRLGELDPQAWIIPYCT
jgi:3-mercaptopyruvate sulfurtransferase SseA